MNRYQKSRATVKAKRLERQDMNQTTLWLLGAFPLTALSLLSYLMLDTM